MNEFNQQVQSVGHKLWPGYELVKPGNRIVSLVPIIKSKHGHNPRVSVTSFIDDQGYYYGVPIKKMPDGTYKYKRHVIEGNMMFDLRNLSQAKDFAVLCNFPFVEGSIGSKRAGSGQALYKVFDENADAQKANDYYGRFAKAINIINNLTAEELLNMSMVIIGSQAIHQTPDLNKKLLGDSAQTNPARIITYATDIAYSELEVVFETAYAVGLITYSDNVGYRTPTGHVLGMTKKSAMTSLAKNSKLLQNLQIESKEAMKDVLKNHSLAPKVPTESEEILGMGHMNAGADMAASAGAWDEGSDDVDLAHQNPDADFVANLLNGDKS